jgi:hypothetical protein
MCGSFASLLPNAVLPRDETEARKKRLSAKQLNLVRIMLLELVLTVDLFIKYGILTAFIRAQIEDDDRIVPCN